jgi:hypothetical protein
MRQDEAPDSPTPLAPTTPSEIARAYADLAMDLHRRIPEIERRQELQGARVEEAYGVALASHGLLSQLRLRVEEIAATVRAKRTLSSGAMAAVNAASGPPSAPERLEIRTSATKTGRHMIVDSDELEAIKAKFAEKDAMERGAKEALAQVLLEESHREALADSQRKRVAFWVLLATAICTAGAWALGHFSALPQAPPPAPAVVVTPVTR